MHIWILSSNSGTFSSQALAFKLSQSGHKVEIKDPWKLSIRLESEKLHIFELNPQSPQSFSEIPLPEVVMPRLGWKSRELGLRIVAALESQKIPSINSSHAISNSSHKLFSLLELRRFGIPVPQFQFQSSELSTDFLITQSSSKRPFSPLVFKQFFGSQGFGVTWSHDSSQAKSFGDFLRNSQIDFFVQQYLEPSEYKDIRCFFIGKNMVACCERISESDLRRNLHQGGQQKIFNPGSDLVDLAFKAHQIFDLHYSAVDILTNGQQHYVLEVNPNPGLEGMSQLLGSKIVDDLSDFFSTTARELFAAGN